MTRRIGSRYTVSRAIGRGTCGTVWSGRGPDGPVAVKLLHEDLTADQTLVARFVQERTVLIGLRHPRVVAVRDLVVDGKDLALVMDLMPGPDLRGLLEDGGPLPPERAAAVCRDIAEALAAAHEQGVVHRDVKPENVLLDEDGRARLTDFGVARLVDGPGGTRPTRIVGTPDYLAPEVVEGCPPGPAVDVYALATLLFELLTGWTPFGGGHPGAVLRRHVTEPAPQVPSMPPPLAELLERCLAKSPAARLSAAEVTESLRACGPSLRGLPVVEASSPHGDRGRDVMTHAGAVPLVNAAEELRDDTRSTHINQIRPIRDALDPNDSGHDDEYDGTGDYAGVGAGSGHGHRRERGRGLPGLSWLRRNRGGMFSLLGLGLMLLSLIAYMAFGGGSGERGSSNAAATNLGVSPTAASPATTAAGQSGTADGVSVAPTAVGTGASPAGGLVALAGTGEFGFASFATLPAPPANVVGAVQVAYFGGFLYAAATGTDGLVRVTPVAAGANPGAAWEIVPGLSSAAQPAMAAGPAGLELYATSTGGQVDRDVLAAPGGGWTGWTPLAPDRVAGPPAAAVTGDRTEVVAASPGQGLLAGSVLPSGRFTGWRPVPEAGAIQPQVALAALGGQLAAYVVRASDGATLRVDGVGSGWQQAWPTGAAGAPATAYDPDGRPDLFVLSVSAGIQVFQSSGRDLHGTMTWVPAGVQTDQAPGVTATPTGGIALAAVADDGSVGIYTSSQ